MADLQLFEDVVTDIGDRLVLREPNRDAIQTLAATVSQYYDVDEKQPPFEAVIDSATGVGKTYILVGAIEFLTAAYGVSDFAVIAPGRTILEKTRDNFTPGHPKSLLRPMDCQPVVVTAENFDTPAMRAVIDDDSQIKVYLFTIQALTKPGSKVGRKTHKFQEGLGTRFYAHLKAIGQLVVFADEHHCYYGPTFSKAIRDLDPWVLVGLTATPHKQTPEDQIIFRYPLAAAIAEKLVKTPVIVGRKDDRSDAETKLTDGVTLLQAKAEALDAYADAAQAERVNPVMLVVAKSIEEADSYAEIVRSDEFFHGAYAGAVLVVHSSAPDAALADLAKVEEPDSLVRIIISVGMLKEGWDVRNVYVIASMRSSVSEILTEQTLGRGMRLPFGHYTEIEILDTLEVIAHERYQDLLQKAGVLNRAFVDYRTRAALRTDAQGRQIVVKENATARARPIRANAGRPAVPLPSEALSPAITTSEERTRHVGAAAKSLRQQVARHPGLPPVQVPVLRMTNIKSHFSLADITSSDAFRKLGARLAADPDGELIRTVVSAVVVTGPNGVKRTELITADASDRVRSDARPFPLEDMRERLTESVLASSAVPARRSERRAFEPLLDAFLDGLGDKAAAVLSANLGRAAARLIRLVEQEQRKYMPKPSCEEIVEFREFNPLRATDKPESRDRYGAFSNSVAYGGWQRCMYTLAWFDTWPERAVANMVDSEQHVTSWARLHIGDIPLIWNAAVQRYNPDLLVIEEDGTHWLVEVKMDKEMDSSDVQAKREAAVRWANHVTSKAEVKMPWRYLLVSETDIDTAKNSWEALKRLGYGR
jgi:type III restriction enzyme